MSIFFVFAFKTNDTPANNTAKAKKSADEANLRSAKAAYQVLKLESATDEGPAVGSIYNTTTGRFDGNATNDACGQCTKHNGAHIVVASGGIVQWSTNPTDDCQ